MLYRPSPLPEGTYVVAVSSLYETVLPTLVMAVAFVGVGTHIALETPEPLVRVLVAFGILALLARLGVLLRYRASASVEGLDPLHARRLERLFAIPYLTFATVFGAFGARAFQVGSAESHMLMVGLLFGYAAGVAAAIFPRPWIAIPSMALAVVPTIAVTLTTHNSAHVGAGALLLMFLVAGIHNTLRTYRIATTEITARRAFALLARADALTGLENRLSLREAFESMSARSGPNRIVAVHCLDLDRFKAVNDTYGHPVGDALLCAVSDRLRNALRAGDVAARVGGDEFVVLQTGKSCGEAALQAQRMAKAIAEPYSIRGHQLSIGTSVGYALHPDHGRDLDDLIARADEALVRIKREGGGVALYRPKAFDEAWKRSA